MKQQYDSYKDSGVEWIGDIPEHWQIMKLKSLRANVKFAIKTGPFGTQLKGEDLQEEGEVCVYNQRNVIDNQFETTKSYVSDKKAESLCSFYTQPRDILITSRGTIGRCAMLPETAAMGILHPCLIAIRIREDKCLIPWLIRYINDTNIFQTAIYLKSNATTIEVIYTDTLKDIPIVMPPLAEQEAIATWLDEKCGEIDKVIDGEKRRITLLEELKQSVITETVTHGLNPDAPLKPSGVDWIGDIPEHWKVRKMRYLCSITTGDKDTVNRVEDGLYPFYVRSPQIERINSYSFDGEAILMAGDGVGAGKVIHYANCKFDYHQRVYNIHNFNEAMGKFLFSYLRVNFKYKIEEGGAKNTVDSVRLPWLKDFPVTIPPLAEQQAIVDYLDAKCGAIDADIAKTKRKIELLQEYKQSLITEAVTGKRKII